MTAPVQPNLLGELPQPKLGARQQLVLERIHALGGLTDLQAGWCIHLMRGCRYCRKDDPCKAAW